MKTIRMCECERTSALVNGIQSVVCAVCIVCIVSITVRQDLPSRTQIHRMEKSRKFSRFYVVQWMVANGIAKLCVCVCVWVACRFGTNTLARQAVSSECNKGTAGYRLLHLLTDFVYVFFFPPFICFHRVALDFCMHFLLLILVSFSSLLGTM